MKDLAGKTAFVTGAASGIGLGVSTALAQAGVKVMMCDIERDALDKAVEGLKRTNADVAGVIADVSLKAELQAAADKTLETYGAVHIIHNNAGVGGSGTYGAWNDAGWSWTIGVNLMAVIWGVEIFGPLIEKAGGGHIVSTASIVVALSEGLRFELAPRGIGVSVLCPGFIRTQIMDSRRNLPPRFGPAIDDMSVPDRFQEQIKVIKDRVAQGIDPAYVGELVREGVENDWPYILTDTEFEPLIEARFEAIKQGFDRIRGREPRR